MRISNKISLFILFLLLILAGNTFIGLSQLSKINHELRTVVERDIFLTETMTVVTERQLEKAVLFERLLRIAEELSFESITPSRRVYLLDHTNVIRSGFEKFSAESARHISAAKTTIEEGIATAPFESKRKDLEIAKRILLEIEQRHILYDQLLLDILNSVTEEKFELSFDDIRKIEKGSSRLGEELKVFIGDIEDFSRNSLRSAKQEETIARRFLWLSFSISLFISLIIAYAIIQSIVVPLKKLDQAARAVGDGNFLVKLKRLTEDEIGEVSRAFNVMTDKLLDFTNQLNQKRNQLAETLRITEEQKRDLEKVNKELDSFVHTVSHDLRSPLLGIIGYTEYLKNVYYDKFDERGRRCLDGAMRSADRMQDLIADLLTLSRISRVRNPYEEVDIHDLVNGIRERLEYSIEENHVDFKIENDLPAIVCDRIKMGEAFLNLINNAIKFSSKVHSRNPVVRVGCQEQDEVWEFWVKDNGIGIPEEYHDEIFEMFKRLHTSTQYEGTGAGLSIVKAVVDSHGGRIWVESEPGHGAEFHFTVPKSLHVSNSQS
ncbi:MAG TPA: ATP-binding protein [Candidatus Omnitrophota bacterium]|nr:ATP-binding protein [Candidatus Omnitrophota bacterium]